MTEPALSLTVSCGFTSRVVTTSPNVRDWLNERGFSPLRLPVDNPAQGLALSPRDARRYDRQTLLLMQVLHLMEADAWLETQRENMPVQLAVGPAQTDLQALLRWSARVTEQEPLPMVQPAQAIGLLPNTPLSHLSIAFGLKGEPMVWAGLQEAGCRALASSLLLMNDENTDEVLCLAVSSPDNYFIRQVFDRKYVSPADQTFELAVAIRFSRHPAGTVPRRFRIATRATASQNFSEKTCLSSLTDDGAADVDVPDGLSATPLLALASLEQRRNTAFVTTRTAVGSRWEFEVGSSV